MIAPAFGPTTGTAQKPEPFSTLSTSLAGVAAVDGSRLDQTWHTRTGGRLRIETPFHRGSVAATVQLLPFVARTEAQPNFNALSVSGEWNGAVSVLRRMDLSAGVQVGSLNFVFIDRATGDSPFSENEFLAGVQAGVSVRLAKGVSLRIRGERQKVYTRRPIHLTLVAVGLEYTVTTPGWLRVILE